MHPSAPVWAPFMHSPLLGVLIMTKKPTWKPQKWMEQKYPEGAVVKSNEPNLLGLPH